MDDDSLGLRPIQWISVEDFKEMYPPLQGEVFPVFYNKETKKFENNVFDIWYQDGYQIKEMLIDGTLNVIMKKVKTK